MSQSKLPNRIPFEDVTSFTNWAMPVMGGKVVPSVQRQDNKKPLPKQAHETVEEVAPGDIAIQPMTAQLLQEITEQASREGFNQGYGEGLEKGLVEGEKQGLLQGKLKAYGEHSQELQQQAQNLAAICEQLMAPLRSQDQDLENRVVNLAVNLAKHLLHSELQLRPEAIFPVVEAAFASLPAGARNLKIYLHPDDLVFVQAHAEALGREWQCLADAKVGRGSCRLETAQSLVEYNIEQRLQNWLAQSVLRPVCEESPALLDMRTPRPLVSDDATPGELARPIEALENDTPDKTTLVAEATRTPDMDSTTTLDADLPHLLTVATAMAAAAGTNAQHSP